MSEGQAGRRERGGSGFSGLQVTGIVVAAIGVTVALTTWVLRTYVFPSEFAPIALSAVEQKALEAKIRRLEGPDGASSKRAQTKPTSPRARGRSSESIMAEDEDWLDSDADDESSADRQIELSERELNGLIARDPDVARRAAIDLSDDVATARLLIPVDSDFPILAAAASCA